MITTATYSEYLESKRKEAVESGYLTDEFIDFYSALFDYQDSSRREYSVQFPVKPPFITDKTPCVTSGEVSFSPDETAMFFSHLEKLFALVSRFQSGFNSEKLITWCREDRGRCALLVRAVLEQDGPALQKTADEAAIGREELLFLLVNWIKPYLSALRDAYMPAPDPSERESFRCPFCGSYSDMGKIVESRDNSRTLHCSLCEYEWDFKRVSCTVCGNEDHETLGFYHREGDELYRVDYCDECKGYLKTLRIPGKFEEKRYSLTVENILTGELDAAALEMGYRRP